MKLLLINHEYPPVGGGAATATFEIARSLSALGHEVIVLTGQYRDLPGFAIQNGVTVHRIWCIRRHPDRSGIFEMITFMIAAICGLPFLVKKCRPDGLIAFFSLPSGLIGLAANVFFGLPYIVSLRGGDVPGLVADLDLIHRIIAPVRRSVLKHALAVVANSEGLRELSESSDRFPISVIPNGVDTDFFCPKSPAPSTRLQILFAGRFHEQKNLGFLLEQVARLSRERFELHLVGDGPGNEQLRGRAQELGIAEAIIWHGWLPRGALREIYQSADCLVNPSLYEGMPNVVLEAMACGLPVIASNVPGNKELVVDGETGFLFDPQSDGLANALDRLIADPALRAVLGSSGRARALAQFSWRAVAQSFESLLKEIAAK